MAVVLLWGATAFSMPYRLPDAELLMPDFEQQTSASGSILHGRSDVAGDGVLFAVTLAAPHDGRMLIGDPWPTALAAGLGYDPGVPGGTYPHFTSLAAYDGYCMLVTYAAGPPGSDVDLALFLNTGLTGPSGFPRNDPTNNTAWQGEWANVALGETVLLTLDFARAEAWQIADNKEPHTGGGLGWPDGGLYAIGDRDRHEISNIGIQIADFDGDALGAQLLLHLNAAPEPTTLAIVGMGVLALRRRRRISLA